MAAAARCLPAFSIIWNRFGVWSPMAMRSISLICATVTVGTGTP